MALDLPPTPEHKLMVSVLKQINEYAMTVIRKNYREIYSPECNGLKLKPAEYAAKEKQISTDTFVRYPIIRESAEYNPMLSMKWLPTPNASGSYASILNLETRKDIAPLDKDAPSLQIPKNAEARVFFRVKGQFCQNFKMSNCLIV